VEQGVRAVHDDRIACETTAGAVDLR
jgi:hypothetical protein